MNTINPFTHHCTSQAGRQAGEMLYETKPKPKDCLLKTNATQSTRYGGIDNNGSMSLNGIYNYYTATLLKGHTRERER